MDGHELIQLEKQLKDFANKANVAERALVEADETYQILDDVKKEYFASLVDLQDAKTTAEKERMALQDDRWSEWLVGYQEARKISRQARVDKNVAVRNWETCRSLLSSYKSYKL